MGIGNSRLANGLQMILDIYAFEDEDIRILEEAIEYLKRG